MRKVTQEELDARRDARQAAQEAAQALKELQDTDWYVLRSIETDDPIPSDVLAKRKAARNKAPRGKT